MLNTTGKFIKHKTGLLNLAEELGNMSKASQVMACRATGSSATNRRSMMAALKLCLNARGASPTSRTGWTK